MNSRAGSGHFDQVNEHVKGLKIHAMISPDLVLDLNDGERLMVPLCEVSFPKYAYLLVIIIYCSWGYIFFFLAYTFDVY